MSTNMSKVNMSLDDIINKTRKNKPKIQIVKSNNNGEGNGRGRLRLGVRRGGNSQRGNFRGGSNSRGRNINNSGYRRFNNYIGNKVGIYTLFYEIPQ